MKAYKGFTKDMQCRGFQFMEGETYHEDNAKLCEIGFHACENPIDCFKYYSPCNSVYHEVELDDVAKEKDDDSKICGKTIKIGAKLDIAGICKAHFEYVKSKTTTSEQGKNNTNLSAQDYSSLSARNYSSLSAQDYSSLSARNYSSLSAQDYSSLSARNYSSLSAQDYSSLSAQDYSSLSARNYSSLSAQDYSSLSARNYSSLSARNDSSLSAQDYSSLSARNYSSLSAQDYSSLSARNDSSLSARNDSSLSAQDYSSLSARNYSSLSAQDYSSLSAQDYSSLSAGENSVIAAFNSKAKGGINTLIALANRQWDGGKYIITDFKAAIVDGIDVKPDTWYELKDGEFVEVSEEVKP